MLGRFLSPLPLPSSLCSLTCGGRWLAQSRFLLWAIWTQGQVPARCAAILGVRSTPSQVIEPLQNLVEHPPPFASPLLVPPVPTRALPPLSPHLAPPARVPSSRRPGQCRRPLCAPSRPYYVRPSPECAPQPGARALGSRPAPPLLPTPLPVRYHQMCLSWSAATLLLVGLPVALSL
jgi:hypothetical protein